MSAFPAVQPIDDLPFWALARASLDYVRDTIEITSAGHELIDALIIIAALDANMAPVKRAPDLQQAYGGAEISAPDDLRRPVSVNAVAQSLNLPFETVRRRVRKLAQAGLCVVGPQGVVVPNSLTTSAADVAAQRGRYDRAGRFYRTLKALGALPPLTAEAAAPPPPQPLVKAANWALSEYVLRACADLIGLTGAVVTSRVLLELAVLGARALPTETLLAEGVLGRPVRASTLAASLKLPRETVRRHLAALEALGYCRRDAAGVTACVPQAARARLMALARANQGNLARLMATLARTGALADWEG